MFSKPEEIIMAALGAVWVVLTYFLAGWTGASAKYVLLITGFSVAWTLLAFVLWKKGWVGILWPLLLGGLVACWWPWLDGLAMRGVAVSAGSVMVVAKPWYASWTFKIIVALIPTICGYAWKWYLSRQPNFDRR